MKGDDAFRRAERELYMYKIYVIALDEMRNQSLIGSVLGQEICVQHSASDGKVAALGSKRAEYSRKVTIINRVLETLSEDERRFIKLKYVQEIPYSMVAKMMPCAEATIYRTRHRVLAKVSVALGLLWEEEEVAVSM